jgi:hypothetical protein
MRLKRPMFAPGHPKGPTFGKDVQIMKFAVHRYEMGLLPKPVTGFTKNFGPALKEALMKVIQPREGIRATGSIGQATFDVLWQYLDAYRKLQYTTWTVPVIPKPVPVPALGPLYQGGASVLNHSLTHNTDGIPHYPAYDDGWIAGRTVLAVEVMRVTEQSSSQGGDAFFSEGKSALGYWYGHLAVAPATGRWFEKGEPVGRIARMETPHVHLGISARRLLGHDFLYGRDGNGPDYTYGSPTVGAQLREDLSL